MKRLHISTTIDSRPPFDGERYWRWEVYRDDAESGHALLAMGWRRTKREALQLARFVRQELRR